MIRVNDLVTQRGTAFDAFEALANKEILTKEEQRDYELGKQKVVDLDSQIKRAREAQALSAATATPVGGQERASVPAAPESDPYLSDDAAKARGLTTRKGLVVGGMMRMIGRSSVMHGSPREIATAIYGEGHPITEAITRSLVASIGASGGFIVPPDYMNEIIELLRPATVVRSANPRVIPMPRGTMTLPGQASPATASYGAEDGPITVSQQTLRQIVASFHKLTAMVPVSNDLMRYADPAADAMVRDDLVAVIALREDLAFLLSDGTQGAPMGFTAFANRWVQLQGGTPGLWSSTADSVAAVNGNAGSALLGQNGGNFVTSNETPTEQTVVGELTALIQALDSANVPEQRRVWFFNPRTYNYLFGLLNSLGLPVFRDELARGTLYGYPFKKSNQIPTNIWDAAGSNKDCSFVMLVEMTEAMILDSMSLELAVSRDGSYIDASGNTQSAFRNDETLIRAIAEHDFQMRHDSAIAVAQFVRWQPAMN